MKDAWRKFRGLPRWVQIVAWVFVVVIIAAAAGGSDDKDEEVTAAQPSATNAPRSTSPSTTAYVPAPEPTARTLPPTTARTLPPTTVTTTPEPVEIATFSGSSTKTTESFSVRSPWRIRWTITGGAGVGITIKTESGTRLEYISTDPGSDETIVRRACTCYLELDPFGSSYTVTVVGVPA